MMNNGAIFPKEKIDKLVGFIINKFAEEKLSTDEAKMVLEKTGELVGEFSLVQSYKSLSNMSCNE